MNNIYYFTGTGNSLQIAQDLSSNIEDSNVNKITEYNGEKIEGDTLGIVFPVYNWGIPLIIRDFIKKLDVSENTYIYAIANYGGLPGKALDMCEDLLREKDLKLSSGYLILMPGNYILGYGAKDQKTQEKQFASEKKKVSEIASYVKERKELKIEKSHTVIDRVFYNKFYKDVKNFHENDKYFTVSDKCIGCGLCKKRCPVSNIKIVDNKPVWQHNCELCLLCLQGCPKEAIDYQNKTKGRKHYINPNVQL